MPKKQKAKARPPVAMPPHTPPATLTIDAKWLLAQIAATGYSPKAIGQALRKRREDKGNPKLIDKILYSPDHPDYRWVTVRELVSLASLIRASVPETFRRFGVPVGTTLDEVRALAKANGCSVAVALRDMGLDVGPTVRDVIDQAAAKSISPATVIRQLGYAWGRPQIPIIGKAGTGGRVEAAELGRTDGPPNSTEHTQAIILDAGSEGLRGAAAFFEARDSADGVASAIRRTALLNFSDQERLIVGIIVDVPRQNVYRVKPLGLDRTEEYRRLISAWPLTWVNRGYESDGSN